MTSPESVHAHPQSRDTHTHETLHVEHGAQVTVLRFGEQTEKALARALAWFLPTVIALILVIAACAVVMGLNLSKQDRQDESYRAMKTQMWLLERRLMDKEALDIINGTRLPSDTEFGPTGNLQRMKPKEQKDGR